MNTLENQLNYKADRELKGRISALVGQMMSFPQSLGFNGYHGTPDQWTDLKEADGAKSESIGRVAKRLEENLFHGYRDIYRQQFCTAFVAKVEAMQAEMEHYIGELTVKPEQ